MFYEVLLSFNVLFFLYHSCTLFYQPKYHSHYRSTDRLLTYCIINLMISIFFKFWGRVEVKYIIFIIDNIVLYIFIYINRHLKKIRLFYKYIFFKSFVYIEYYFESIDFGTFLGISSFIEILNNMKKFKLVNKYVIILNFKTLYCTIYYFEIEPFHS